MENRFEKALERIKRIIVPQKDWDGEDVNHYMTVVEALSYCAEKENMKNRGTQ